MELNKSCREEYECPKCLRYISINNDYEDCQCAISSSEKCPHCGALLHVNAVVEFQISLAKE